LAFVGESGSGKTTLVNILAGLMPVDEGGMFIDGQKVSELDIRSYQSRIGYITQEPVIFSDTIFNNVTFWDEFSDQNYERFQYALKRASILDYVEKLPKTYNTMLGSNGVNLSGGQKQRISIARELYKNIDILIMDEATSALDTETESSIQENIDALKGEYTLLIVAHRLSTIKNADRIVLMKEGEIENIGNYADLVQNNKEFERMVKLQEL
jgi:subfamily B ATP-binding cassette protein MsbA